MARDGNEPVRPLAATLARGLGPLEMEILGVVWDLGEATSRDVFEKMRERRRLGQSTVLTVLRRLTNRGLLLRSPGDVYLYSAAVRREELGHQMIDNVIERIFQGAAEPVVSHLLAKTPPA